MKNLMSMYAELNNEVKNAIREMVKLLNDYQGTSIALDQNFDAVMNNIINYVEPSKGFKMEFCFITKVSFDDTTIFVECEGEDNELHTLVVNSADALQRVHKCLSEYIEEYQNSDVHYAYPDKVGCTQFKDYDPISNDVFSHNGKEYYAEEYKDPHSNKVMVRIAEYVGWITADEFHRVY